MSPGQTLDLLRIEATARPEPRLELMRRQLQSLKGTVVGMFLSGAILIILAFESLTGLAFPAAQASGFVGDGPRILGAVVGLLIEAGLWAIWVWRAPRGFWVTCAAQIAVSLVWYSAASVIGPARISG